MTFDQRSDPAEIVKLAREKCGAESFCMILGWTDSKFAARAMPMTDREVARQTFQYSLNRSTGLDEEKWDCRIWKNVSESKCIAM